MMKAIGKSILLTCLAVPVVVLGASPSATAQETCQGRPATIVASSGNVAGTPGNDVIVASGLVDHVSGGAGDDLICLVDNKTVSPVSGGPGDDVIDLSRGGEADTFLDGGSDRFIGSPQSDYVYVSKGPGDSRVADIRTGAGSDSVTITVGIRVNVRTGSGVDAVAILNRHPNAHGSGTINLGSGHDYLRVADTRLTKVDLQRRTVSAGSSRYRVERAQNVFVYGRTVEVRGSRDANSLEGYGCSVRMSGADSQDVLRITARPQWSGMPALKCPRRSYRLDGQGGDDQLFGSVYNDVLIGGAGFDTVDGGLGKDRCDAEQRVECEG